MLLIEPRSAFVSRACKHVAAVGLLCDDNDRLRWKEAACEMLVSALVRVGALGWPIAMTKACTQDDGQKAQIKMMAKPGITDNMAAFIVGRLGSSSSRVLSGQ